MELTSDILEAITGSAASPTEKREDGKPPSRRFPFGSRASVFAIRDGVEAAEHLILLRETSAAEFSFIDDEARNIGDQFAVWFNGSQNRRVKVLCVVTRSEPTTTFGTEFIIGARFEKVLETASMNAAPADTAQASPPAAPDAVARNHSTLNSANVSEQSAEIKGDCPSPAIKPNEAAPTSSKTIREPKIGDMGEASTMHNNAPQDSVPERAERPAGAPHGASGGKNQQILAKVLARLADQEQAVRRLEEERNHAVAESQTLSSELAVVKLSLETLQAKCDADDAAIGELAKLMETELPGASLPHKAAPVRIP